MLRIDDSIFPAVLSLKLKFKSLLFPSSLSRKKFYQKFCLRIPEKFSGNFLLQWLLSESVIYSSNESWNNFRLVWFSLLKSQKIKLPNNHYKIFWWKFPEFFLQNDDRNSTYVWNSIKIDIGYVNSRSVHFHLTTVFKTLWFLY